VPEQHFGGDPAQGHGLSISSNELYGEIWAEDPSALKVELERSLAPRATTMLYDEFARLGVGPDDLVLDAGGRDAVHAIEIVRRLDCRAITIDPVPLHVDRARERVAAAGLEDRIDVLHAATESLPFEDASIDFVWCRDVLNHVQLDPFLREFARVLRSGGSVLVYQTFAETACEPEEARRLFAASASVAENVGSVLRDTGAQSRIRGREHRAVTGRMARANDRGRDMGRCGRSARALTPAPPGARRSRAIRACSSRGGVRRAPVGDLPAAREAVPDDLRPPASRIASYLRRRVPASPEGVA
jgi:SAM-dependent methyltransferase